MSAFDSVKFSGGRPLLKEVSADKLNAILAEIRKNRPRGERGITVRESGSATYIGLAASLTKSAKTAQAQPWDIYVEGSEGEGNSITYTLKVRPGTLAGILAENWDDEFEVTGNGLFYGIAKVTTDGEYITGVEITLQGEEPEFQQATKWGLAPNVDILFGIFKEGESYNVTEGKNIVVSNRNVLITRPTGAQPGEPQFDLWFRLQ